MPRINSSDFQVNIMLTYLLIIVTLYLVGNAYIFIRARQALKVKSLGAKILLTVLFWRCALSFFVTMLARNLEMPALSPIQCTSSEQVG